VLRAALSQSDTGEFGGVGKREREKHMKKETEGEDENP
jgi:hypothetical protein